MGDEKTGKEGRITGEKENDINSRYYFVGIH